MIRKYQAANYIVAFALGWSLGFPWGLVAYFGFAVASTVVLEIAARRAEIPKAQVLP